MKPKLLAAFVAFFSLCACSRVIVSKQPGYDFPPTDPDSIQVYEGVAPNYPFVIIGRIGLDMTWTIKPGKDKTKIERKAAQSGADGIIISGLEIDIDAFNKFVAAEGYEKVFGSDLSDFSLATKAHALYLEQSLTYGYMIKRTGRP
jgi:hypothetical protein